MSDIQRELADIHYAYMVGSIPKEEWLKLLDDITPELYEDLYNCT